MKIPAWTLGDVCRKCRLARGWTQADLAKRAGLNEISINRLERTSEKAERATIERVARALQLSVSTLYGYVEFSNRYAELSEAQQHRIHDVARVYEERNQQVGDQPPSAQESEAPTGTTVEFARPTKARRAR